MSASTTDIAHTMIAVTITTTTATTTSTTGAVTLSTTISYLYTSNAADIILNYK